MKTLLRIDPLVGMYVLDGSALAIVRGHVEGQEPRYLVQYFGASFTNAYVMDICQHPSLLQFFYSLKEAERCRDWREEFWTQKRKNLARWSPPVPDRPQEAS